MDEPSPAGELRLVLPVPPSINHQYATVQGRRVLSRSGREFKAFVAEQVESWLDDHPQVDAAVFQPTANAQNSIGGIRYALFTSGARSCFAFVQRHGRAERPHLVSGSHHLAGFFCSTTPIDAAFAEAALAGMKLRDGIIAID